MLPYNNRGVWNTTNAPCYECTHIYGFVAFYFAFFWDVKANTPRDLIWCKMRGINSNTEEKISALQFNLISQKHLMFKKENLISHRWIYAILTAGKESNNWWNCNAEFHFSHLMKFLRDQNDLNLLCGILIIIKLWIIEMIHVWLQTIDI
jgi:hypothetical protein